MKPRPSELLVPALFALFGGVYALSVHALPRESTVFPYAVLAMLAVLSVPVLVREAGGKQAEDGAASGPWWAELRKPALVLGASIGYLVLFNYAGFVLAGMVFMTATMLALRVRARTALAVSVPFVVGMYLLFSKLFYVDL